MPLIPLALHLPPLLLRLLLLVLPFPPFVPGSSPQHPLRPSKRLGRALSDRHHPARHRWSVAADAPLVPAHPAKARPAAQPVPCSRPSALDVPQSRETCAPPRPTRHSGVFTRNPVCVPRPAANPPKCTPRRPKSFLEKTLIHAQDPERVPSAASRAELRSVPSTRRTWTAADSSERRDRWHAPWPLRGRSGVAESRQPARPLRGLGPRLPQLADLPKKRAKKLSLASPPPKGAGWRERVPPKSPTLFPPPPCRPCGHEGKTCTLRAKSSTIIDESRS